MTHVTDYQLPPGPVPEEGAAEFYCTALRGVDRSRWVGEQLVKLGKSIDLALVERVAIESSQLEADIACLARLMPAVTFASSRMPEMFEGFVSLHWATIEAVDDLIDPASMKAVFDIVFIVHPTEKVWDVVGAMEGFARVAAWRDASGGYSVSVFGHGLARALFKPTKRRAPELTLVTVLSGH